MSSVSSKRLSLEGVRYFDAHCHCDGLPNLNYQDFVIACVSTDNASARRNLSLKSERVLVGVAVHPWEVHEEDYARVLELAKEADFVGEIGLDFRFSKASKERQAEVLRAFAEAYPDKTFNVHALDAWREALDLLVKLNVRRAIFHWYSGPPELLKDIEGAGYFISVNPFVKVQRKHGLAVSRADPSILLTESDGGYEYRGVFLKPDMIPETLEYLANVKGMDVEELRKTVASNFLKAFQLA
ncbi:MAG: TatD family hydrolase [Sulfolobales archaeon]|nr:TatD family hydrolase [Sulfolobales archaeon]